VLFLIALIWFDRWAAKFIGSIVTVGNSIAFVGFFHALPKIRALELIRRACYRWTIFLILEIDH
jgi:hypothetical protein